METRSVPKPRQPLFVHGFHVLMGPSHSNQNDTVDTLLAAGNVWCFFPMTNPFRYAPGWHACVTSSTNAPANEIINIPCVLQSLSVSLTASSIHLSISHFLIPHFVFVRSHISKEMSYYIKKNAWHLVDVFTNTMWAYILSMGGSEGNLNTYPVLEVSMPSFTRFSFEELLWLSIDVKVFSIDVFLPFQ